MAVDADTVADIEADLLASGTGAKTDLQIASIAEAMWRLKLDAYTESSKTRFGYLLTNIQDRITAAGATPSDYELNDGNAFDLLAILIEALRWKIGTLIGGKLLYGTDVPADSLGDDGDLYFKLDSGLLYEKASGAWSSTGYNLTGPTGPQGDPGDLSGTPGSDNTGAMWSSSELVQFNAGTLARPRLTGDVVTAAHTITYASTVPVNMQDGVFQKVTLAGNPTIGNPTNLEDGQTIVFVLIQDATGSRVASWSSYWKFLGGVAPTLSTSANAIDMVVGKVLSSTQILCKGHLGFG